MELDTTSSEMENMSQAELEALEDKTVADDAKTETEDAEKLAAEKVAEDAVADDVAAAAKIATDKEAADKAATIEEDKDLINHVSPPQKWIDKRLAAKAGKVALAEVDSVTAENAELKQRLDWLETQLSSKGGDAKLTPAEVLSPEKIEEVRKEFGDGIADMFTAVRAVQGNTVKSDPAPKSTGENAPVVNEAMDTAISENDDLSYWQEHSGRLWERAIKVNDELVKNPEYINLSFDDRFKLVVEKVKADVVEEAKSVPPEKKEDDKLPPESLAGGAPSKTQTDSDVVDRVLAADPEEAIKIYDTLSQADKDKVDIAVEI